MKKIIFAIMALMVIGLVASVSAVITPAEVTGTIFQHDGVTPVDSATVTATCGATTPASVLSLSDGTYDVQFNSADCPFGASVSVTAVKGSETGTATGTTCASVDDCPIPVALVDVSIPEFGIMAGAVALIGALGIFVYKRKD